jgi:recombinational DNA repair protein (RecF pathway)
VTSGGIICNECASLEKREGNALIYSPAFDIIDVFRFFISKPIETFGKVSLKADVVHEIRTIISEYISRYLGVDALRTRTGQAEQFTL